MIDHETDTPQPEIEVRSSLSLDLSLTECIKQALADGVALQFYATFHGLKKLVHDIDPTAQVWYTERNGDGIGMVCPAGTPASMLPSRAKNYAALEWIDPDAEFGSGVVPKRYARNFPCRSAPQEPPAVAENLVGYEAPDSRPWWKRLIARAFPAKPLPDLEDVEGMHPGYVSTYVVAHLSWPDRLRVLISGRVNVVTSTRTDVLVSKMQAKSAVWIAPPFGD